VTRSMAAADTYRRYAAECLSMSQRQNNAADNAALVQMAMMWQRLAELADKNAGTEEPPSAS
jgi:hypothetical protein